MAADGLASGSSNHAATRRRAADTPDLHTWASYYCTSQPDAPLLAGETRPHTRFAQRRRQPRCTCAPASGRPGTAPTAYPCTPSTLPVAADHACAWEVRHLVHRCMHGCSQHGADVTWQRYALHLVCAKFAGVARAVFPTVPCESVVRVGEDYQLPVTVTAVRHRQHVRASAEEGRPMGRLLRALVRLGAQAGSRFITVQADDAGVRLGVEGVPITSSEVRKLQFTSHHAAACHSLALCC